MRNALCFLGLACGLLIAMATACTPAQAQSASELVALYKRVMELYGAGKFAEAIPLAKRYAEAMTARHGPEHSEYATALNHLALLLQATNRVSEAEPLFRRALAINERNLGSQHPAVAVRLTNLAMLLQATSYQPARYGTFFRSGGLHDAASIAAKQQSPHFRHVALLQQALQCTMDRTPQRACGAAVSFTLHEAVPGSHTSHGPLAASR